MAGSKKGEHRGNARKRAAKPNGCLPASYSGRQYRKKHRSHETPGEIMTEAVRKHHDRARLETAVVERRIQVARIILGYSGEVDDVTPKEALLMGQRHALQAIKDLTDMLEWLSKKKPTKQVTEQINVLEVEIERQYAVMGEFAFKVAPFIHPKLQAIAVQSDTGANQATILQELFDEVDSRERSAPIPIEHKPSRTGS